VKEIDRRAFLGLTAGMLTVPAALADGVAQWHGALIVNALGGLGDPNNPSDDDTDSLRAAWTHGSRVMREALASGLTAVNCTLGYVAGEREPFESTIRDIAKYDTLIRANATDLLKVYTAADLLRAKAEKKIGIIYGFQNAAMVGNDASRIEIFAGLGVRVIQLTYNPANQLGDGSVAHENRDLTPFGREVVERLNTHRVMVDLSHSGEHTCLDAARASKPGAGRSAAEQDR
jgi:membrane dipeptidase